MVKEERKRVACLMLPSVDQRIKELGELPIPETVHEHLEITANYESLRKFRKECERVING